MSISPLFLPEYSTSAVSFFFVPSSPAVSCPAASISAVDEKNKRSGPALLDLPLLAARIPAVSSPSIKPESSLRHAFVSAGLEPRLAITALDADLIKTYVRVGLGVGVLAEMAMLAEDAADLRVLAADGLFPACTTWIVLPRDRVLRDFALEFIALFAPQIDRRDVRRAFDHGDFAGAWPLPPVWRELVDSKARALAAD